MSYGNPRSEGDHECRGHPHKGGLSSHIAFVTPILVNYSL
jgi:hypothetical protein